MADSDTTEADFWKTLANGFREWLPTQSSEVRKQPRREQVQAFLQEIGSEGKRVVDVLLSELEAARE
jgi:DNA gyrase inhibitor GyrI